MDIKYDTDNQKAFIRRLYGLIPLVERVNDLGGAIYLVGGSVRDLLIDRPSASIEDVDLEIFSIEPHEIESLLASHFHSAVQMVGKSFGVYKISLMQGGLDVDIALPRVERKQGSGHRGFDVTIDPFLTLPAAARRRDFTINAMAIDLREMLLAGTVAVGMAIDFNNGLVHLHQDRLVATSDQFGEDPLRVLRAMQFASRFNLRIDEDAAKICRDLRPESPSLAVERVWEEWRKWSLGAHPNRGLAILIATHWLKDYPMLEALLGCRQDPRYHPEGGVFVHTSHVVDWAAAIAERDKLPDEDRSTLVFAALLHDVGKPGATVVDGDGTIRSPGHAKAALPLVADFAARVGMPIDMLAKVSKLVATHMDVPSGTPSSVRRLANRLHPATIGQWERLIEADASGRPPLPATRPCRNILSIADQLEVVDNETKPILLGRHLIDADLMRPGPPMGGVLKEAYEAQINGEFEDLVGAFAWARGRLGWEEQSVAERAERARS